jgi:hypothetical protein
MVEFVNLKDQINTMRFLPLEEYALRILTCGVDGICPALLSFGEAPLLVCGSDALPCGGSLCYFHSNTQNKCVGKPNSLHKVDAGRKETWVFDLYSYQCKAALHTARQLLFQMRQTYPKTFKSACRAWIAKRYVIDYDGLRNQLKQNLEYLNFDTSTIEKVINLGKQLIGVSYGGWLGGELSPDAPMWCADAPIDVSIIKQTSCSCVGLTNLMLRSLGVSLPRSASGSIGGTLAYGEYFRPMATLFDDQLKYPIGTLIGRHYRDLNDQGHVAVVIDNNRVLQSFALHAGGVTPGVNMNYSVPQSHNGNYYEYAVLPQHWLVRRHH